MKEPEPQQNDRQERPLNVHHVNIGLTTLIRFWPEDRDRYIDIARGHRNPAVDDFIDNGLDFVLGFYEEPSITPPAAK